MRNGVNTVFKQNGGANPHRTRPLAHVYALEQAAVQLFVLVLGAVVGHIDERWLVGHQFIQDFVQRLDAFSL